MNTAGIISSIAEQDSKLYDQGISKTDCLMRQFKMTLLQSGLQFSYLHESLKYMPREKSIVVPIVLDCFTRAENVKDRQQLLRWLHFKGLYEAVPVLLDEFKYNSLCGDTLYLWAVAETLYQIKCPLFVSDYLSIACNPKYGISSQMIVLLLGTIKSSDSVLTLMSLLSDDDITLHVITALGKIGDRRCVSRLEEYIDSQKTIIRKEAQRAILRINAISQ